MFSCLREIQGGRPAAEIHILDHGCGGGLNSMYLAALGYRNVYGVNVNAPVEHLNRILHEIFGIKESRYLTTDGGRLPFADETFDFITSNQVLEHVSDDKIDLYYAEEGRVLKAGGGAFHEVPHVLVPYDSHSRVWFAHMAPKFLRPLAYGVLKTIERRKFMLFEGKTYADYYAGILFLRTPSFHRRLVRAHIGGYRDLTLDRLLSTHAFDTYDPDGRVRIRRLMQRIMKGRSSALPRQGFLPIS